ncbi:MAG: FG-GAP repeat domain-containing protein, partial [Saprospiraceae bacterium]
MKTKLSCVFIIFKILLISSIYSQSFSVITLNMPLNAELVEKIDVDSDGDQDLIVTYKDTSGVWWYKNIDGKGSFSIAQLLFSTSEKPVQLYVADFDKDEDQDIAYYINGNEIKIIWRENINENFSTIKEVGIFSSFAQKPIVMADFDQDGDFDFLAQAFSSNLKIELFQNNTGVFQKTSALLPNNIVELQNLSLIDINEDDQLDILLSGRFRFQDSSAVLWFRGIIDTFSFAPPQIIQTFSDVIRDVTIADLDEDGDQDILTYTINELQNKVHWFENLDRSEQFGQGRVIFEYSDFVYRDIERTIITIDTDNDDDLDIFCTADISIGGHDTYAHFENTDGKGSFQKLEPTLVGADKANSIILSDIDGNSSSDIIFISDQRDALVNIKFNTDHTPVEKVVDQGCGLPNNLSVADFDNDGFQDVMVGAAASNNVLWYKNINGKQFSRQEVDNIYNEPRAAIATDIDGDQKTDILVSYYQSGILWYRNEAEGKFAAPIQIVNDNAGITWSIAAGDIDGDGDNDIVSLPQNISQSITTYLTVYENV